MFELIGKIAMLYLLVGVGVTLGLFLDSRVRESVNAGLQKSLWNVFGALVQGVLAWPIVVYTYWRDSQS
jgi:hypothetical protein